MPHPQPHPHRTRAAAVLAQLAIPALLVAGCASASENPQTTTLKFADAFALTHPFGVGGLIPFRDAVEDSGLIDIEYFDSGQMGKQADLPSVIRSGVVDMGVISPAYTGSTFPLSNVADLPGFGTNACVIGAALLDLVTPGGILYDREMAPMGFRPLFLGSLPGYEAMTAGETVTTPGDLDGSVLRSTGGAADRVVGEVGAAGVAMPIGDLYEALSRGTVDGTLASPISITPYGLHEVISHSTQGAELGSFAAIYGIRTESFEQLTAEQQQVLIDAGAAAQQTLCAEINDELGRSTAEMADAGVEFTDVSADPAWAELTEPVRAGWVTTGEKLGLPAGEVLAQFTAAVARHEQGDPA